MARKLLICISAFTVTAAVARGRRLGTCQEFEDDEEGQAAFQAFLRRLPALPTYVMVDTVDEDYRLETLPHATGRDRRDLIERKLRQIYRNSTFVGASLQSRDSDRRRDDRYLLAAVTNVEIFDPWLRLVTAQGLPVAGVFPVPLVSLALLRVLDLRERNVLMVSNHCAGVRQTFLREGRFRISRLTPMRSGGADSAGEAYAEEIKNTRMYLDALNITHVDDNVQVLVLDQNGSLRGLAQSLEQVRGNFSCRYLGPAQIATLAGIAQGALESSRDALHLHLLARKAPQFNLAPAALMQGFRVHRARHAIIAAAAAAMLCTGAWAMVQSWRAGGLEQEAARLAGEAVHQQMLYQEITRTFPPAPTSAENLQHTVELAGRIEALARTPAQVFQVVSTALEANPAVSLQELHWRRWPGAASRSGEANAEQAGPETGQGAQLQLELRGYTGGYRGSLAAIDRFVASIAAHPAVASARASHLPVNLDPGGTLSGSTTSARQEQAKAAQFEVQLQLKPGI